METDFHSQIVDCGIAWLLPLLAARVAATLVSLFFNIVQEEF